MVKIKGSGLLDFVRAVWSEWFTAMSGPLSVPAAVAALWIENPTAKIILGLTAFVCVWAASYAVWKKEREKVLAFEEKASLQFSPNDSSGDIGAYTRDVPLYDAVCRMFLGRWEKIPIVDGRLDLTQNGFQAVRDLIDRVRQLAFDGRLPIWGKKQGHLSLWEKPVPSFWKNYHIDYSSFAKGDAAKLRVIPSDTGGQTTSLRDLMTSKAAVDTLCRDQSIASELPTNDANSLCIITGTGKPFDHVEANQFGVHHTISVGIKNVGSKKITNCNFYRTYIAFTNDTQKTWLDGPFSLDPNETRYLSIAMFNETKDLPHANHLIGLSLPPSAFGAGVMDSRLPPDKRHVLSFAVESTDTGNDVLHCELWVDETGKLRLESLEC